MRAAAIGILGAFCLGGPALAGAHLVTGSFGAADQGAINFSGAWYHYWSGSIEFQGADLLSATISSDSAWRWQQNPHSLGVVIVPLAGECTAAAGGSCTYGTGDGRLDVESDGLTFVGAHQYGLTPQIPLPPTGGPKVVGLPMNMEISFLFAPHEGRDVTYTLRYVGEALPEPSTWAMMIMGFGLAGSAVRNRRAAALAQRPAA